MYENTTCKPTPCANGELGAGFENEQKGLGFFPRVISVRSLCLRGSIGRNCRNVDVFAQRPRSQKLLRFLERGLPNPDIATKINVKR